MASDDKIIDWRSTGRRKARRELFNNYVPFKCEGIPEDGIVCGKTTTAPPKDAPPWFDEIWPEENRVLSPQSLQADHKTKDVTQNDVAVLAWRCASHHKIIDSRTSVGQSQITDPLRGML